MASQQGSRRFSRRFKRSALCIALGMCFAGGVQAQSSVGSIFGETGNSAQVTIENLDTGTTRSITSSADGNFTFPQLAPGRYRVTSGNVVREVQVRVGTGTHVNLGLSELETVTVRAGSSINTIDVSSVESTTVFTQEQIQALPVGRDITNVALLAPGTVKGDTGFGNLASFGGASVAENGYYINGFDVTNIFNFLSYGNLPFDAIAEQQVKTGGYGAEYGRSLGGVINLVTKSGSNEWKGGAAVYWSPSSLRAHGNNVAQKDPELLADGYKYFAYRSDDESSDFSYNVYAGGPLVKDRLFIFGLIEGRNDKDDIYYEDHSQHRKSDRPTGLVKLDWNITNDHRLELTAITNRTETDYTDYRNPVVNGSPVLYTGQHGLLDSQYSMERGGEIYIGKYTGYLTDNFTLSAQYGYLKALDGDRDPALLGSDNCSRAYDSRSNPAATIYVGCYNEGDPFVRDQSAPADADERKAWRIDGEWHMGDHTLRFGVDSEEFLSQRAGQQYSGDGLYYRYYNRPTDFTDTAVGAFIPAGTPYVRTWDYRTESGGFEIKNQAAYIEDSWQITDNFLAYLGLRAENFENLNGVGITFAESDTLWAPRLGFSYDVKGDSTIKVFGNAGRYFIPIAGNTSVRMAGGESGYATNYYYWDGQLDTATGLPANGLGARINAEFNEPHVITPNPATVAATNLKPMYQDEFILGAQFELNMDWMLGFRAIHRKVGDGMDDFCAHKPLQRWAEEQGYDDVQLAANYIGGPSPTCYMINPGNDVSLMIDLYGDGSEVVEANIPASYFGIPKYERKYNALEVFFERYRTENWYLQGSYTMSWSKGTAEGYVNSTLEQTDAGITQDWDYKPFTDGSYGYLPNDRRHTFKLFGAYEISEEFQVGANFVLQSGRPVSCYGYIPLDDESLSDDGLNTPVYDYYVASNWSGSSFYCANANGEQELGHRGNRGRTPWTYSMDLAFQYTPNWANQNLSLELKVFNVFNSQKVTEYYEFSQYGGAGAPVTDPNFLNDSNYQTPRSAQVVARYKF